MEQIIVDNSPYQEQTFLFNGLRLRLTLRYNSIGDVWEADIFNVTDNEWIVQGLNMVVGVPLLARHVCPFFLWLTDESGLGLDPTGGEDLGVRCKLYIEVQDETVWPTI